MGLNTFTPQPSTVDFHQRGYQIYGQHRFLTGADSALTSQISYKTYDADTTPAEQRALSTADRHHRRRILQPAEPAYESLRLAGKLRICAAAIPRHPSHSRRGWTTPIPHFDGRQTFLPAELVGSSGSAIERITFTRPSSFSVNQNEAALYVSDEWSSVSVGLLSPSDCGLTLTVLPARRTWRRAAELCCR